MMNLFRRLRQKLDLRRTLGRKAERLAAKELQSRGYRILARNVVFKEGEIDILAMEGETLAIVEVKSMRDPALGYTPELHLNRAKREKLLQLAESVKKRYKVEGTPLRFDLVAVEYRNGKPDIRVFPRAFDAKGRPA